MPHARRTDRARARGEDRPAGGPAPARAPARRAGGAALLALLGLAAGCAGGARPEPPPIVPAGWRVADEGRVRPTLEEIFLEPPIFGRPPELVSASADARFALVRWGAPQEARPSLRLVAADGSSPLPAGTPVESLLPAGEEAGDLRAAWAGLDLVVARGARVWRIDPRTTRAELVLDAAAEDGPQPVAADPLQPAGAEQPGGGPRPQEESGHPRSGAPEEEPAAGRRPRALGAIRRLEPAPGDARALRVGDGRELFEILLGGPGAPPFPLDQATWWTRDLETRADDLEFSEDLSVVYGRDPVPRPEASPGAQVWRTLERRAVVLEGLAEIEELESARLSPDGAFLVACEVDPTDRPEPTVVPDYLTPRVSHREGRRRLADDRPELRRLWLWDLATGARTALDLGPPLPCEAPPDAAPPAGLPRDHVRVVGWAPAGPPALALERVSEDYRTLELWVWRAGGLTRLHREHDPRWIGGPARTARWESGGLALAFGSEVAPGTTTPGRSQLFRVALADGVVRQLTEVAGEVSGFAPLADGGWLVQASGADPARRSYARIAPEAARSDAPLAHAPAAFALPAGTCEGALAAADGARLFARRETLLGPAEVVAADLAAARAVTATVPPDYRALGLEPPARIEARAPDGERVAAHVYLPPGVELDRPGPPRAAVVFAHGAGYLQNVTDSMTRYPLNALFHVRLARLGYPVIDVDYRGSAGYGGRFRGAVQHHLGGKDLDDVHAVVDLLVDRGLVDPRRVGIYGGSYGGFLALMALFTAPERWAVGCALRSVTDWRTYHPGYTQPRLGRPSTHPEAYARSSPIDLVAGLEDPLLVLHGMRDSNVFAQDSLRLIEELIDRGKPFDAMLYPSQGHAFDDGAHWLDEYRRIERYLIEHLGPPLPPEHGIALDAAWIGPFLHPHGSHRPDDDDDGGTLGPDATLSAPSLGGGSSHEPRERGRDGGGPRG